MSPSTVTRDVLSGSLAGPRNTAPVHTLNWAPCNGHVTVVLSSEPSDRLTEQVDECRWTGTGTFKDCGHAATPKRDFRLWRPVLRSVDTRDFTARSV